MIGLCVKFLNLVHLCAGDVFKFDGALLKMTTVTKRCPFKVDVNDAGGNYCDVHDLDCDIGIDYTFTQWCDDI